MKRRWIIRGFFIGLLLLLVGGWGSSYSYAYGIGYVGGDLWTVQCSSGGLYLHWVDERFASPDK